MAASGRSGYRMGHHRQWASRIRLRNHQQARFREIAGYVEEQIARFHELYRQVKIAVDRLRE